MAIKKLNQEKHSNHYELITPEDTGSSPLDLFAHQVPAGFPSPAEDFLEKRLDLNDYLIKNRSATFLIKVKGDSMVNAGIFDGDILVVDRSVEAGENRIVVGVLNGEFTVKRIRKEGTKLLLLPESDKFKPIEVTEEMNFQIWGVVTFSIHKT
ncbi:MAG: translesion error-prone DNA polymerase V autoproteolytic subunit [Bacteroidales bacterium]